MRVAIKSFAIGLAALVLPVSADAQEPQLPKPDAATQARIDEGVRIGREIYSRDQAAWYSTDAMRAELKDEQLVRIVGFLTERVDAERVRAVYVERSGDELREAYSAVVRGQTVESGQSSAGKPDAPALSASLQRQFEAQDKVRKLINNRICGRLPNIVVLDSAHIAGGLDVYAIVPEMRPKEAVLAGHKRVTFGPDGGEGQVHDYYNSCLTNPEGRGSGALVLSVPPNRGDVPHEMHIFGQLNLDTQFIVLTMVNGRSWGISQGIPLLLREDKELAIPQ